QSARTERAIARLAILDRTAGEQREQQREDAIAPAPARAHLARRARKAGAEHVVGLAAQDRADHRGNLRRIVLAVAVEVDRRTGAALAGCSEPGPDRGAQPAAVRLPDHDVGPGCLGNRPGAIGRAVVDDDDVGLETEL